ncbi:MAG: DUF2384 domain-containing protein [Nitrospiraceae bacterium]|nr:DUF2384 domain-containing protein [Nitrospiraceae bacterium]
MKTDFTKKPDTGRPEGRIELARMVLEIFDLWGLKVKEQLSLLGLSPRSRARLKQYLEGEAFANQLDLRGRAMNLLSIQSSLGAIYPNSPEVAVKWMTTPKSKFDGLTPVDYVHKEGFFGLSNIKRDLEFEVNRPPFDAKKILRKARAVRKKIYDVSKALKINNEIEGFYFDTLIRKGIPFYMARRVQRLLDISDKEFARFIGIGMGTFRRLKIKRGRLSRLSSDQVYRLSALFAVSVEVLGSEEAARKWFTSGLIPLRGRTPLDLAETDPGSREVESLLGGIMFGTIL